MKRAENSTVRDQKKGNIEEKRQKVMRKWSDINNSLAPQISNIKLTSSITLFAVPSSRSHCRCIMIFDSLSCWHSSNLNRMLLTLVRSRHRSTTLVSCLGALRLRVRDVQADSNASVIIFFFSFLVMLRRALSAF